MISKLKKRQPKGRTGQPTGRKGRPLVDPAAKRNVPIHVLTTKNEKVELQHAADEASMSVSTWMRNVSLERARTLAAAKAEKAKQAAHD